MHSVQSSEEIGRSYKHSERLKRNQKMLTSNFLRNFMKKAVDVLKYFQCLPSLGPSQEVDRSPLISFLSSFTLEHNSHGIFCYAFMLSGNR